MQYRLSLSGERHPGAAVAPFDGVGLIRSEYVIRAYGEFITQPGAQRNLAEYLCGVADSAEGTDVWYRTSELTSQEANTLVGVDRVIHEADFMKGRRGIRRALELPDAFETELRVVAEVAQNYPNLHVLTPFVRDAADFGFAVDLLSRVGWPNRFGSMVEIPSALLDAEKLIDLGASNLMLGLNDLSSLLTGTSRQDQEMKWHESVWWAVETLRGVVAGRAEWGIAGNLTPHVLDRAQTSDVPYASLHYSELPGLLGIDPADLPDADHLSRTKALTRARIAQAEASERLAFA